MAKLLQKRGKQEVEIPLPQALLIAQIAIREQKRFAQHLLLFLTLLLLLTGFTFATMRGSSGFPKTETEATRVEYLNRELDTLRRYLGKTLSEALRLKLATLEQRIRLGQTGLGDLELIESMKQDLKLLTDYRTTLQKLGAVPVQPLRTQPLWQWAALIWGGLVVAILMVGSYWLRCWWRLRELELQLRRFHS